MNAIPTIYRGVRFRSRLEAKWAAFFDYLGWEWEYEAIDLKYYIPDFYLTNFKLPTIVEVKPVLVLNELYAHTQKIEESGWEGNVLLVGARLFSYEDWGTSLGLYHSWKQWDSAQIVRKSDPKKHSEFHYSVYGETGSWQCAVCGEHKGAMYGHIQADVMYRDGDYLNDLVRKGWIEAGNKTQWMSERTNRKHPA